MDKIPPGTDLFQIPYQQPPPGIHSDFNKRSDLLYLFRGLVPTFIFLTTVFMIFRIRARIGQEERWKLDDWFTTATWICTTGLGILLVVCVQKLGRETWNISLGFLMSPWPQRVLVAMGCLIMLALLLGKLSILALHYRFFGHMDNVRHQIHWTNVLCFPILAAVVITPTLAAPPLGKPWGTPNPHNKEGSIVAMTVGIVNILVDLLALYIPIPCVLSMNLSRKKKAGVLAVFLTGIMAIIADAIVMYYRVRLWKQIDPLRDGMIVALCSFIEASISIICSSMPCGAKVWKVHIVGSGIYSSLRSRFASVENSGVSIQDPSQFPIYPKPPQKKRRGLYSIGTLPTTVHSVTRLSKSENLLELRSVESGITDNYRKRSTTPDRGNILPTKDIGPRVLSANSGLSLQDLSNYLSQSKTSV